MKKVSNSKNMGLVFGNKTVKNTSIQAPKIYRPVNPMTTQDLPITGGNGLDGYILDVMILK